MSNMLLLLVLFGIFYFHCGWSCLTPIVLERGYHLSKSILVALIFDIFEHLLCTKAPWQYPEVGHQQTSNHCIMLTQD